MKPYNIVLSFVQLGYILLMLHADGGEVSIEVANEIAKQANKQYQEIKK